MTEWAIDAADIEAAHERIKPYIRRTPVLTSQRLNDLVGAEVFCKAENLQHTGAFKFRGACNAVGALAEAGDVSSVMTYSSGNHGQAISRAAQIFGLEATVIMPFDAPRLKRDATAHWGATIVEYDRYSEQREAAAERLEADGLEAHLIPPYDHPLVMAGQGTAAKELFEDVPELDQLFVCVGGGGLLAGSAIAKQAWSPHTSLVGVEPAVDNDHEQSREAGKWVDLGALKATIADGQQTRAPGLLTWPITGELTEVFTSVTDDELLATMRFAFETLRVVLEPSGASALAAILHRDIVQPGSRVGVTLSGGNVGTARFTELIS